MSTPNPRTRQFLIQLRERARREAQAKRAAKLAKQRGVRDTREIATPLGRVIVDRL